MSTKLFYGIWAYDILFASYVFIMLTVRGPFIMVCTVCICKELDCLVGAVNWYGATYFAEDYLSQEEGDRPSSSTQFKRTSYSGPDMQRFVKKIFKHHLIILRYELCLEIELITTFLLENCATQMIFMVRSRPKPLSLQNLLFTGYRQSHFPSF